MFMQGCIIPEPGCYGCTMKKGSSMFARTVGMHAGVDNVAAAATAGAKDTPMKKRHSSKDCLMQPNT
jgi:hypothetical protein